MCPFSNVFMRFNSIRDKWEATIRDKEICVACKGEALCLSVCPSYDTDYIRLANSDKNRGLGIIRRVRNGYSTDTSVRRSRSSGGFIYEMCRSLLKDKEVDGIISIKHVEGLEYFPSLYRKETDLIYMPTSIYHNINYERAFDIILSTEGRFLIIGLPCQITAIEKFFRKKKYRSLANRIYAKVALICGYSFDRTNIRAFGHLNGITIREISYRGDGRYKKTKIKGPEGSKEFDTYSPKNVFERIRNNFFFDKSLVQNNCLYCMDHLGYCADIVVGDSWQPRYSQDFQGTNLIICRTEIGEKILQKIERFVFEDGYIDEIVESQGKEYALNSKAGAIREMKFRGKYYIPRHVTSVNIQYDIKEPLTWLEKFKIKYVKPMLRMKLYKLAWLLYLILNLSYLTKIFFSAMRRKWL
jgi:coenzyme F420-reducing hydrogenase beta subunit